MSEGSDYTSWQALVRHHRETADVHMRELCATDPVRFRKFSLSPGDLIVDYSKDRITARRWACSWLSPGRLASRSGAIRCSAAIFPELEGATPVSGHDSSTAGRIELLRGAHR